MHIYPNNTGIPKHTKTKNTGMNGINQEMLQSSYPDASNEIMNARSVRGFVMITPAPHYLFKSV